MDDNAKEIHTELDVLDDLIKNYYKLLLKNEDEKVKLGDLLKMIELKRKLTPENSDQKKFWKMLNKIRKENLQDKDNSDQKQKNQVKDEL